LSEGAVKRCDEESQMSWRWDEEEGTRGGRVVFVGWGWAELRLGEVR